MKLKGDAMRVPGGFGVVHAQCVHGLASRSVGMGHVGMDTWGECQKIMLQRKLSRLTDHGKNFNFILN